PEWSDRVGRVCANRRRGHIPRHTTPPAVLPRAPGVAIRLDARPRRSTRAPPHQTRLARSASPPAYVADARETACPTPWRYATGSGCSRRGGTAVRHLRRRAMEKLPPCGPRHYDTATT